MAEQQNLQKWVMMTHSKKGESYLLEKYLSGDEEGRAWFESVKAATLSAASAKAEVLLERPLMQQLIGMSEGPLTPKVDNFTPPERTPWGGHDILRKYKRALGVSTSNIVGESWEVSGHPSFPNRFKLHYEGRNHLLPITVLEELAPQKLYGEQELSVKMRKMPLLVKLLNSGSWHSFRYELLKIFEQVSHLELPPSFKEWLKVDDLRSLTNFNNHELHRVLTLLEELLSSNDCPENIQPILLPIRRIHEEMLTKNLSVQVHPRKGDIEEMPSKTEAWTILHAETGAGIYLGLKEGVTRETFEEMMLAGKDLSGTLNFVEVEEGDVFYIPAGTLHAIGAGILLAEVQETSESTFRAYDWGRMQEGKPRPLHFHETMQVTHWEAKRGAALVEALRREGEVQPALPGAALVEILIDEKEFQQERITFENQEQEYLGDTTSTGVQAFTVLSGEVTLHTSKPGTTTLPAGQSFIVPASVGTYRLSTNEALSKVLQFTAMKKEF